MQSAFRALGCLSWSTERSRKPTLLASACITCIKNWTSALFLSDCAELISLVISKSNHTWDCKYIIKDFFDIISWFFCKWFGRKGNFIAHNLCKLGKLYTDINLCFFFIGVTLSVGECV